MVVPFFDWLLLHISVIVSISIPILGGTIWMIERAVTNYKATITKVLEAAAQKCEIANAEIRGKMEALNTTQHQHSQEIAVLVVEHRHIKNQLDEIKNMVQSLLDRR